MTSTTLSALQKRPAPAEQSNKALTMGFSSLESFELMQRAAKLLASSTLVPVTYRAFKEIKEYGKVTGYESNGAGLANCVVALNMAQRMGADPLMVMQNLHVIEGRPSWSSQFIIAAINSCGRYSPLRFELSEAGESEELTYTATEWKAGKKVSFQKTITVQHQSCVAWAVERGTDERLESPKVTIQMAIDEGWLTKNGSKWQTMPELMLRYRCASMFGRLYAPELLMGLQSTEEVHDFIEAKQDDNGDFTVNMEALRNQVESEEPQPPALPDEESEFVNDDTGEITEQAPEPEAEPKKTARQARKPAATEEQAPEAQQVAENDNFDLDME